MDNHFFLPAVNGNDIKLNLIVKDYIAAHQNLLTHNSGGRVSAIYGSFPRAIWNGGRTLSYTCSPLSKEQIEKTISFLNNENIEVRMTFTNSLLENSHLNNEYCNMILEAMDNGFGNSIITASPILDAYLQKEHPNLGLISSITKGNDFNTFKKAYESNIYKMVVVYPKRKILNYLKNNTSFHEREERIEVLIASGCGHCPITAIHYEAESFNNLHQGHIKRHNCFRDMEHEEMIFSFEEQIVGNLNELSNMGLKNYKIQGRNESIEQLIKGYTQALFKNECQEQVCQDLTFLYNNS